MSVDRSAPKLMIGATTMLQASANGLTALAVFHELFQKEDVEKMAITLAESMGQRVAFEV